MLLSSHGTLAVPQGAILRSQKVTALLLRPRKPDLAVVALQVRVGVHEGGGGGGGYWLDAAWGGGTGAPLVTARTLATYRIIVIESFKYI